ncbi:MAG: sporulation peptidase YabG [Firmicutes bacterium]|nr:sporulation peptidase YabG [Bacillota bacterium]
MANVAVGDLVIRKSHGGDIVFKVTNIYEDNIGQSHCTLKGMHLRLVADAPLSDLERVGAEHLRNEILHMESQSTRKSMNTLKCRVVYCIWMETKSTLLCV